MSTLSCCAGASPVRVLCIVVGWWWWGGGGGDGGGGVVVAAAAAAGAAVVVVVAVVVVSFVCSFVHACVRAGVRARLTLLFVCVRYPSAEVQLVPVDCNLPEGVRRNGLNAAVEVNTK